MSRCVNLNHAFAKAVGELVRVLVEAPRDLLVRRVEHAATRSVVSIVGAIFLDESYACGTVPAPAPSFGVHWFAPAGLLVNSHS